MSSIEEGMQRISRDFDAFVARNVTNEWDKQKERIFEHFGLYPKSEGDVLGAGSFSTSTFSRSVRAGGGPQGNISGSTSVWVRSAATSILGKPVQAATGFIFTDVDPSRQLSISRPIQARQQNYAVVVRHLNEARLVGAPFPILHKFEETTANSGGDVVSYHPCSFVTSG